MDVYVVIIAMSYTFIGTINVWFIWAILRTWFMAMMLHSMMSLDAKSRRWFRHRWMTCGIWSKTRTDLAHDTTQTLWMKQNARCQSRVLHRAGRTIQHENIPYTSNNIYVTWNYFMLAYFLTKCCIWIGNLWRSRCATTKQADFQMNIVSPVLSNTSRHWRSSIDCVKSSICKWTCLFLARLSVRGDVHGFLCMDTRAPGFAVGFLAGCCWTADRSWDLRRAASWNVMWRMCRSVRHQSGGGACQWRRTTLSHPCNYMSVWQMSLFHIEIEILSYNSTIH